MSTITTSFSQMQKVLIKVSVAASFYVEKCEISNTSIVLLSSGNREYIISVGFGSEVMAVGGRWCVLELIDRYNLCITNKDGNQEELTTIVSKNGDIVSPWCFLLEYIETRERTILKKRKASLND